MWPFSKKNKKTEQPTSVYRGTPRSGRTNQSTANPRRTQLNDSDISTTQAQQASFYAWGTSQVYGDDSSTRHSHHDSSSSSYDSGSHHSSGSDSGSYSSGSDSSSSGSDSSSW